MTLYDKVQSRFVLDIIVIQCSHLTICYERRMIHVGSWLELQLLQEQKVGDADALILVRE